MSKIKILAVTIMIGTIGLIPTVNVVQHNIQNIVLLANNSGLTITPNISNSISSSRYATILSKTIKEEVTSTTGKQVSISLYRVNTYTGMSSLSIINSHSGETVRLPNPKVPNGYTITHISITMYTGADNIGDSPVASAEMTPEYFNNWNRKISLGKYNYTVHYILTKTIVREKVDTNKVKQINNKTIAKQNKLNKEITAKYSNIELNIVDANTGKKLIKIENSIFKRIGSTLNLQKIAEIQGNLPINYNVAYIKINGRNVSNRNINYFKVPAETTNVEIGMIEAKSDISQIKPEQHKLHTGNITLTKIHKNNNTDNSSKNMILSNVSIDNNTAPNISNTEPRNLENRLIAPIVGGILILGIIGGLFIFLKGKINK